MAPYNSYQSVSKAILHAQAAVKGSFELETGDEGSALTDDENSYLRGLQRPVAGQGLAACHTDTKVVGGLI